MTLLKNTAIYSRRIFKPFLVTCLLTLPLLSYGWSEAGHVVIAELAMDGMTENERQRLNQLAQSLAEQNPEDVKRIQRRGVVSPVAQTASWIDGERSLTIEQIFKKYGHQVPAELRPFSEQTTRDWHYSNQLYFDQVKDAARFEAECTLRNSGQLNQILPHLRGAFLSAEKSQDKAIVLAMLVHFISDAHQPLHGITRVTHGCNHDRGGNGFCVEGKSTQRRCKDNLHRLWDSGFGLFHKGSFEKVLASWRDGSSVQLQMDGVKTLQFHQWQAENLALAEAVYAVEEGARPDAAYRERGQIIVHERVAMAAQRLASVLHELLTPADE